MKTAQQQIGVAVVGCGYWGMNYIRVFHELPEAKLVAACDTSPQQLAEITRRFPNVQLSSQVDDLLQLSEIDAVVICTGATTHYDFVRRALAAEKHVLVEKPMATTVREAEELLELATRSNRCLLVGHTFLYNEGIRRIKEQLGDPEAGEIYYLYSSRTNLGPIRHDVNAIWDLAPHDISIFNYLLDDMPTSVSAVGLNALTAKQEDVGFITLRYGANIIGHIHVSWVDPNKVRKLVVVGSHKRIVFDDLNSMEQVRIFEKGVASPAQATTYGEHQFDIRDGDIFSPKINAGEPLKQQSRHFLDCIDSGVPPLTDGRSGLNVVRVLAAIDESIAQNGAPAAIESTAVRIQPQNNGMVLMPLLEEAR